MRSGILYPIPSATAHSTEYTVQDTVAVTCSLLAGVALRPVARRTALCAPVGRGSHVDFCLEVDALSAVLFRKGRVSGWVGALGGLHR